LLQTETVENRQQTGMTMATRIQTPEHKARDNIDPMLEQAGWKIQPKKYQPPRNN
jgi:type I site-specific restriction endonuclease